MTLKEALRVLDYAQDTCDKAANGNLPAGKRATVGTLKHELRHVRDIIRHAQIRHENRQPVFVDPHVRLKQEAP